MPITVKQPITALVLRLGVLLFKAWIFIQTFNLPVPGNRLAAFIGPFSFEPGSSQALMQGKGTERL